MAEAKETTRAHKKEAHEYEKLKATAEKAKADFISFERKDIKFRGVSFPSERWVASESSTARIVAVLLNR